MPQAALHVALFIVPLFLAFSPSDVMAQGGPLTPGAKGEAVVAEVVDIIHQTGIFPDDKKFLCRVAWVESKYGNAPGTFRPGYYGGIWQVDRVGYQDTVDLPSMKKYHTQLKEKLHIDWTQTSWEDLTKPLYSGLAARLFLVKIPAPIPSDLPGQAAYWKRYYNTAAGKGTVEKFIEDVEHATGCAV